MGAGDRWRFRLDGVPRTVGRDHELDQLQRLLSIPKQVSTVVLWGLGGVGKSWLAQTYAVHHRRRLRLRWWINAASRLEAIADLAKLAKFLDIDDENQERAARNVLLRLGGLRDWLLVYDDADDPAMLAGLLPTVGDGEVIVTSRHSGWSRFGEEVHVQPFDVAVAAEFLSERTVGHDPAAAEAVAKDLGGLPLALTLAAAYCRRTRTPLDRYHRDYVRDRQRLIADADFAARDHPVPVVLAWRRCLAGVGRKDKAAPDLMRLLASFAPRPVPRGLLSAAPKEMPRRLRRTVNSPDRLGTTIQTLTAFGLVEAIGGSAVTMHRLIQEITYALSPPDQLRKAAHSAVSCLLWSFPADVADRENWPDCSTLFSHARTALTHSDRYQVPGATDAVLRTRVGGYLLERGEHAHARDLLAHAYTSREVALGADHPTALLAAIDVARVDRQLGNAHAVHRRMTPVVRHCRRVFGPGHQETLAAASHLADALQQLGELETARELGEEVLAWCRAGFGFDHPRTLIAANNVAGTLHALGRPVVARRLYRQVFTTACEAVGPDHAVTVSSAYNLSIVLRELGDLESARGFLEYTLDARRRMLGVAHPVTERITRELIQVLADLGETERADSLRAMLGGTRMLAWRTHPNDCVDWVLRAARGGVAQAEIEGCLASLRRSGHGRVAFAAVLRRIIGGQHDPRLAYALDADEAAVVNEALRRLDRTFRTAGSRIPTPAR